MKYEVKKCFDCVNCIKYKIVDSKNNIYYYYIGNPFNHLYPILANDKGEEISDIKLDTEVKKAIMKYKSVRG